jgi:phage replication O-like protein O
MTNTNYIRHSFQNPNIIIDSWAKHVSGNELKLIQVIIRKTLGFNKEWDRISIRQLQEYTGLSRRTCQRLRDRLVERGLILMRQSTGGNHQDRCEYCVNLGWQPDTGVKETRVSTVTRTGVNSDTGTGVSGDTHKTHIILQNPQDKTHTACARAFALNNMPPGIRDAVSEFVDAVDPTTNLGKCRLVAEIAVAELGAETVSAAIRQARDEVVSQRVEERFLQRSLFNLLRNIEGLKRRARLARPPDEEWIIRGGENAIAVVMHRLKYGTEIPEGAKQWIPIAQQRLSEQSEASKCTPRNAMYAEIPGISGMQWSTGS